MLLKISSFLIIIENYSIKICADYKKMLLLHHSIEEKVS